MKTLQHILKIVVFIVLKISTSIADEENVFENVPQIIDINEGLRVDLPCTLKSQFSNQFTISWLQNDEPIVPDQKRYFKPQGLQILTVDRNRDAGSFQCIATNRANSTDIRKTEAVHINIKWVERGSVLLKSPGASALPLLPKMQVVLKCNITGNPSLTMKDITWTKDKVELSSASDPRISFKSERMTISNLTLNDYDGRYECCARHAIGDNICSINGYDLKVRDVRAPLLIEAPQDQTVLLGSEATFRCKFDSTPPTNKIVWTKLATTLKPRQNEECKYCDDPGTFTIKSVREKHVGKYTCTGTGPNGDKTSGSAWLKLAYLDQFDKKSVTKYVGKDENLECVCQAPDGAPPPNITWYRHGEVIENKKITPDSRIAVSSNILIIDKPTKRDEGIYVCVASNVKDTVRKEYNITLTVDPVIRTNLRDQTLNEGLRAVFTCDVIAVPRPTITWYKDETVIQQDQRHVIIENKLSISDINLSDAGTYKCVAWTTQSDTDATSKATLRVIELMKLNPKPLDTCIEYGKKGVIKCGVRGASDPKISWISLNPTSNGAHFRVKTDKELTDTRNLIFPAASDKDPGVYKCQALDHGRNLTTVIRVTVTNRPKLTTIPENITEFKGKRIVLRCASNDKELPVSWKISSKLDDAIYTQQTGSHHVHIGKDGSLLIQEAEISDTGWYTCMFTKCDVTVNATAYVSIAEPHITNDPDDEASINKKVQTIAFAVGSAVAYVLVTLTVVIYCRRKKRSAKDKSQGDGDEEHMLNGYSISNGSRKINNEIPMEVLSKLDPSIESLLYDKQKLEPVLTIGRGQFGNVFLSKAPGLLPNIDDDVVVMVKELDQMQQTNSHTVEELQAEFNREVALLYRSNHENIVQLLGICCHENPLYPSHLITEYLEWGILKSCLQAQGQGKFGKTTMMNMCCQLAAALEHLTQLNIPHRDVATRNCVISSKLVVKLSMLSFSVEGFEKEYYQYDGERIPLRWCAPEIIQYKAYSTKSDIWAFGVTCWEIFSMGRMPFSEIADEDFINAMNSNDLPVLPNLNNSKRISSLITKCCQQSPSVRPEFYQIVRKLQSIITGPNVAPTVRSGGTIEDTASEAGPLLSMTDQEAPCSSKKTMA